MSGLCSPWMNSWSQADLHQKLFTSWGRRGQNQFPACQLGGILQDHLGQALNNPF